MGKKIRVLHYISSCARGDGVAQVVINFYREAKEKVQFDFLLYEKTDNSFAEEIVGYGGRLYYSGWPSIRKNKEYLDYIDIFFEEHKDDYDIIHIHELYMAPIIIRAAKKHCNVKVIVHSHTTIMSKKIIKNIRNSIMTFPTRFMADYYLACSQKAGKVAFGSCIVSCERFAVIKNGIACEKYTYNIESRRRIRDEFGIQDDEILLGHVGRYSQLKNQEFVVKVFKEFKKLNNNSKLLLVGNGELFDRVRDLIYKLDLQENVIQCGIREDVNDFFSAFDIFVFPSLAEGLGIVLIEAQSNGVPCVASDVIPNEAFLASNIKKESLKHSAERWAQSVQGLLNTRNDKAQKCVRSFGYDIKSSTECLIDIYNRLI